jgi:hypothetical protein
MLLRIICVGTWGAQEPESTGWLFALFIGFPILYSFRHKFFCKINYLNNILQNAELYINEN